MRIGEFGLASGIRVAGSAYHRHHGQPQRLAARELEQIGDQFARRLRMVYSNAIVSGAKLVR